MRGIPGNSGAAMEPPPYLVEIIVKTARFVASKGGSTFEQRIADREKENPNFAFLKPDSPFNLYYKQKLHEEVVLNATKSAGLAPPPTITESKPAPKPSAVVEKAASVRQAPKEIPPPFIYAIDPPPGITGPELDTMKLTAQFVARNGRLFLTNLTQREHRNPMFDFLSPSSTRFAHFQALVENYKRILNPPEELLKRLQIESGNRLEIHNRALKRVEWERYQEDKKKREQAEADRERVPATAAAPAPAAAQEDMEVEMEVEAPRAAKTRVERSLRYQVCPKCHREIPIEEMEEHWKAEMMDTKAREERLRQLEQRQRGAAQAEDEEIVRNLQRFATKRPDIFEGPDEDQPKAPPAPPMADFGAPPDSPPSPPSPKGPQPPILQTAPRFPSPRIPPIPIPPAGVLGAAHPLEMGAPDPAKKARTDEEAGLVPEHIWIQGHPGPVTVQVRLPSDLPAECAAAVQSQPVVSLANCAPTDSIQTVKERLRDLLGGGLAPSKQKLRGPTGVFFREAMSLAFYNLPSGAELQLVLKERGGRKK
ncbi:putative splicing factor 3A subunit 1 [Paratrimastix pyriformis]|uniref:Splicing factor 3A subunit 1 n=1 Tax=Paratrimastix pyriformis TaxID=342808 RepID=A0ABQ8UUG1_9EUKA|nr:putative splicing factor 3A subunit 1 [Paratrimastix pyriformis]